METKHNVQVEDNLYSIAKKYYGNGDLWPEIFLANPQIIDKDLIYPDQILLIPNVVVNGISKPVLVKDNQRERQQGILEAIMSTQISMTNNVITYERGIKTLKHLSALL